MTSSSAQAHLCSMPSDGIDQYSETTTAVVVSVLDSAEPPGLWDEMGGAVKEYSTFCCMKKSSSPRRFMMDALVNLFPILQWGRDYDRQKFRGDLMAGLTLASLGIPQSIGYANLAKLDPQFGLYTSVVPPLIYGVMGSSREIAVGPVAVVSLLLSSMAQKLVDPVADPAAYRKLIFTATFFTGLFQAAFGLLRFGFLVDLLSHAALVGFMGGAAIVIGLQQLKGLLGISHFTNKTDVVSVVKASYEAVHKSLDPSNLIIGASFLIFILSCRFIATRKKKLFLLSAMAPLVSVVLSTLLVFATKADEHGVKIVKHVKGGFNRSSMEELEFQGPLLGEAVKIGLITAIIALTEAIAVGRSFATIRGYHLDGNKEMVAMGFANLAGSLSSCYAATGSFSRTAVNFSAGCRTSLSNIVMAITVIIALEFLTKLLYYTPTAILASIILSALPGLVDFKGACEIWQVDKVDFLTCLTAFLGVIFGSVEIGLLAALSISFLKIIVNSARPRVEILGRIPGKEVYCNIKQYPVVSQLPGLLITRISASYLSFINATFVRERIMKLATTEQEETVLEDPHGKVHTIIIDLSNVASIDTSGISALQEIHENLHSQGLQIAIVNPGWQVVHKLKRANLVEKLGGKMLFLTVSEAAEACWALTKQVSMASVPEDDWMPRVIPYIDQPFTS